MLVVTPGGRATLVTSDDLGVEAMLAAPIEPAPSMPVHVKISVKGTKDRGGRRSEHALRDVAGDAIKGECRPRREAWRERGVRGVHAKKK